MVSYYQYCKTKGWDNILVKDLVKIKFSDDETLISLMPKFRHKLDAMITDCVGQIIDLKIDEYYLSSPQNKIEYRATIIYEFEGKKFIKENLVEIE